MVEWQRSGSSDRERVKAEGGLDVVGGGDSNGCDGKSSLVTERWEGAQW